MEEERFCSGWCRQLDDARRTLEEELAPQAAKANRAMEAATAAIRIFFISLYFLSC